MKDLLVPVRLQKKSTNGPSNFNTGIMTRDGGTSQGLRKTGLEQKKSSIIRDSKVEETSSPRKSLMRSNSKPRVGGVPKRNLWGNEERIIWIHNISNYQESSHENISEKKNEDFQIITI